MRKYLQQRARETRRPIYVTAGAWAIDAALIPLVSTSVTVVATAAITAATIGVYLEAVLLGRKFDDQEHGDLRYLQGHKEGLSDRDDPGDHLERRRIQVVPATAVVVPDIRPPTPGIPGAL